jgi:hypothetical protein
MRGASVEEGGLSSNTGDSFSVMCRSLSIIFQKVEKVLSPLLEERVRERGGSLVSVLRSTPHPSPPLKGEGVRRFLKLLYNLFIIIISHFLI